MEKISRYVTVYIDSSVFCDLRGGAFLASDTPKKCRAARFVTPRFYSSFFEQ